MDLATSQSQIDLQSMPASLTNGTVPNCNKVKIALSLYKVQQNIYLLDFQRVEVRIFIDFISFYFLSAFITHFLLYLCVMEEGVFYCDFSAPLRRANLDIITPLLCSVLFLYG